MATAATIKKNIAKLEAALKSKATPKSLKSKLEVQLVKSKAELSGINKGTKPKASTTKSTQTALQKLKDMVKKNKKLKTYKGAGVDLEKDADRPALPTGRRTARQSGKTYYEYRANRIDVKQPPKRYPKLEKGGYMADGGFLRVTKENQDETLHEIAKYMVKSVKKNADLKDLVFYFEKDNDYDYKYRVKIWDEMNVYEMKKTEENIYKVLKAIVEANEGGKMAKGGKLKIGGDDFSFLLELSDNELSERLDLVRKQQKINGEQYFAALNKKESTQKIEDSGEKLANQERAIIEARLMKYDKRHKMEDGGYMAKGGMVDYSKDGYVKAIRGVDGKLVKEVVIEGVEYKYNPIYKTYNSIKGNELLHKSKYEKGGYMAKGGSLKDNFSDKIEEGDIVWDERNKNYGVVLNTYDYQYGEIRLDSDGNQPIEYLHKLGSEGDKGTKAKLQDALIAYKSLRLKWPEYKYEKVNYAKGGLTEHGLKVGDTIVDDMFWDKSVKVLNSKTGYAVVKIETGERKEMKAMGGEMHRTQE